MNDWITLTQFQSKEKIRLKIETIVGIRPCGTAVYGSNVDLNTCIGMVAVEEFPEVVWKLIQESK